MLSRHLSDDAEPNAHPTLGGGHTKRGRPASGVIRKVLSTMTKYRNEIHHRRSAASGARRCQPKGFDRTCTQNDLDADDQLGKDDDDRIAVLGRQDEVSILSGIDEIEGPSPSFVCFGAS